MLIFNNVELADVQFVYGFFDRNSLVALREYRPPYPDRRLWKTMCRILHPIIQ
jgi:hypothetical protein